MSLLAVLMMPLAWAIAHQGTEALLKLAAAGKIYLVENDSVVLGAQTLTFVLLLSIWILVSTIAAPRVVIQAIQTGSQIGVALASSMGSSMGRGVSYGAGAAMTMTMAGHGAAGVAAGAGAGTVGGLASGAAGGSGIVGPTIIGAMAMTAGAAPANAASAKDVNREAAAIAAAHRS